jgi:hypothetical protein
MRENQIQEKSAKEICELALFYGHICSMSHGDWNAVYKELGPRQTDILNMAEMIIQRTQYVEYLRQSTERDLLFLLSKIETPGTEEAAIRERIAENAKRFPDLLRDDQGDIREFPFEYSNPF